MQTCTCTEYTLDPRLERTIPLRASLPCQTSTYSHLSPAPSLKEKIELVLRKHGQCCQHKVSFASGDRWPGRDLNFPFIQELSS